jgi:hypothetical protein
MKREFVTHTRFTKVTNWLVFIRDCDWVFCLLVEWKDRVREFIRENN